MSAELLPHHQSTARLHSRRWAALALLMVPVLVVALDNTALTFALPAIAKELGASGIQILWIVDAYPLVLAALLVAMGGIGDRVGRRRLLLLGSMGFAAASFAAAFAPSPEWLIAGRAAMGLFGATLMPSTLSLIRNIFSNDNERRMAIAVWAATFSGGAALGPIAGGWLVDHFWWGAVLMVPAIALLPLLVLGRALVPESRDESPHPLDLVSIVLSILTMGPTVIGIKELTVHGLAPLPVLSLAAGLVFGAIFVRRQMRSVAPMLDLRLFANPVFGTSVLANVLSYFSLTGFIFFFSQHLQLVEGMSPFEAGLLMLPASVATVMAGLLAVPLVRGIRPGTVVASGMALSALAYALVAFGPQSAGLILYFVAIFLLSIGIGAAETISNDLILSAVPAAKAGAASAISETGYELGALMGTAVLGSILTAGYQQHLQIPAGVGAGDAATAHETLAGALEVADSLGGELGSELAGAARQAFDSGVTTTSVIAFILMSAVSLLAAVRLRSVPKAQRNKA